MSRPRRRIWPALGASAPVIRLSSVVLPAPFGPIRAWRAPSSSRKSTPAHTRRAPKLLYSSTVSSAAGAPPPSAPIAVSSSLGDESAIGTNLPRSLVHGILGIRAPVARSEPLSVLQMKREGGSWRGRLDDTSEAIACRPHRDVTGQIVEPAEHPLAAVLEPGVRLETRGGALSGADPQLARVPGSPKQDAAGQSRRQACRTGNRLLALRTAQTMTPMDRSASRPGRAGCPIRPVQRSRTSKGNGHKAARTRRSSTADWIRSHRSRAGSWRRRLRSVMVRVADRASRPWGRCEDVAPGNAPNLPEPDAPQQSVAQALREQAVPQPGVMLVRRLATSLALEVVREAEMPAPLSSLAGELCASARLMPAPGRTTRGPCAGSSSARRRSSRASLIRRVA